MSSVPRAAETTPGPAPVAEPFTGAELARDLAAVRDWGAAYWRALPGDDFFAPLAGGWSPADHVRHLARSNRPVARALELPRVVLLARFGATWRDSRGYSELRAAYREALDGGLQAGRFAPDPLPATRRNDAERLDTLERWSATLTRLAAATRDWSERGLARLRLPHPGLGLLTVREMLLFTLYHNTHHVLGVARRRSGETHPIGVGPAAGRPQSAGR